MNSRIIILVLLALVSANACASLMNFPLDALGTVEIRDPISGTALDSGAVGSGTIGYDPTTGGGSFTLNGTLTSYGSVLLHDTTVTTNSDGSLHFQGLLDISGLGISNSDFVGNLAVGYNYDSYSDVSWFTYNPLTLPGMGAPGFLIQDGSMGGSLIDFNASTSALAFVANPFPTFVPVPAAIWLFGSGLIGLLSFSSKRST